MGKDSEQDRSEKAVEKSIVVAQGIERSFRVWTEQIHTWWPTSHSLSGNVQTRVMIEGKVNGRFFERTPDSDYLERLPPTTSGDR